MTATPATPTPTLPGATHHAAADTHADHAAHAAHAADVPGGPRSTR